MSYLGSKAASGAYQAIIANMPAHDTYIEAFLGTGAIFNKKPQSITSIGIELDKVTLDGFSTNHAIQTHNTDALSFLENFDFSMAGRTFVYADPPYLPETRTSNKKYRKDFTVDDHISLLELAKKLTEKGVQIMLSGYPSKLYDETLKGWRTYEFQVMTRGGARTEKLWMNYESNSVHWASFAGVNFTDRQRIKRKAQRWAKNYKALDTNERLAVLAALMEVE
ncbi:DNA adenine methylase [Vibrio lentus]|uniref:site-specific DNA-methyltransferase (adenine-specific) n=2 Tax=Vibrio lentus TaxID=136468 RepID=A0A855ISW6_9VIBR|nr:DNA adenine methylase [Vibrio lentus]PMM60673.1 DNA methylase [Vibrio lentus]